MKPPHWAQWWTNSGIFAVEPRPGQPYFSLAIPPPNVTGSLHMGQRSAQAACRGVRRMPRFNGLSRGGRVCCARFQ